MKIAYCAFVSTNISGLTEFSPKECKKFIVKYSHHSNAGQVCQAESFRPIINYHTVLIAHRLAYLCCQCDDGLDMKLALVLVVARNEQ